MTMKFIIWTLTLKTEDGNEEKVWGDKKDVFYMRCLRHIEIDVLR